ncbi:MAG TPA: HAD hydrolase-like protein [Candidatus Eisenbacteria bacterium]|nr:HAD hydrolase-like protein [Candidatus Eisenbacteria bacterium]
MTRPRRLRYEHVAIDLDGTLIDSRADLAGATNHVLESFGFAPIAPESVYALVGEGARRLVSRALGESHAGLVDEGVARFLAYYADHLLDRTRLYPGVPEALSALAASGAALSVLTNKPVAMSRTILSGLGVATMFCDVIGGDSLPSRKPDPAGLDYLRGLTGTSCERTLLVGDSTVDLATAVAGGTAFCGVGWGLVPAALRAANPERIVDDPRELVDVVIGSVA